MNREIPLGCCGDIRCLGCAWECDPPDADHDYAQAEGVLVCQRCGNQTPRIKPAALATRATEEPS
jgi:hypothetical protein